MRSNARRDRFFRSVLRYIVPGCALLTLVFALVHARLLRTSGLGAALVQDGRAELRGVLLPPAGDHYRFLLETRSDAEVLVDGRVVADHRMVSAGPSVLLDRRQHEIVLRYVEAAGTPQASVLCARAGGPFRPLPRLLVVPQRIPLREVDLRRVMTRLGMAVPILWLVIAAIGLLRLIRPWRSSAARPAVALAAAAALFTAGVWWGVPGPAGWAPDEVGPIDVRTGMQAAFAGGWASIYPPFHHAVVALLYVPFEAALGIGIGDLEDVVWSGAMLIVARALSIVMALGIVWIAHRIAFEQFGRQAGAFTAWLALSFLPLSYYAKTANLDVPYVFWLMLSLLFFARLFSASPRSRDFYLFTFFGVVAICTKDQAYGFYVLPGVYLLVAGLRGPRAGAAWLATPSRRVLGIMTCIALAAFAILHNLPFNVSGFAEHVRLIAGPGSEGYAMFPNTPGGHVRMLVASVSQLGHALSWPILGAAAIAIASAIANRAYTVLWLLFPCVSYYLMFISVVRYHYDRFFLGIGVVLAIVAGWWIDRWLAGPGGRTLKLAAVVVALGLALTRALALDVMMANDPRYEVEAWLRAHVAPTERVTAIGHDALLPRSSMAPWKPARLNPELLTDTRPEFLIVNVGFAMRAEEGSPARQMFARLDGGATDYRRVGRFRGLVLPPLSWERRFQDVTDDPFTNLTKVNPTIDVYVRGDVAAGAKIIRLDVPTVNTKTTTNTTTTKNLN
jgi:hypothetical protein